MSSEPDRRVRYILWLLVCPLAGAVAALVLVAVMAGPVTGKPGNGHGNPHGTPVPTPRVTPAPTVRPTATPRITPVPTPPSTGYTPSAPLRITADDVVVEGKAFSAASGVGIGILAVGTAQDHIRNLTIRHCSLTGFDSAIWVGFVDNVLIEDVTVDGAKYAGIMVLSAVGGTVQRNHVTNIGVGGQVGVTNAYGIAISQQQDADPQSTDTVVQDNTVDNVPTWHGLDTHAGIGIEFRGNTVTRSRSGIFVTAGGPRARGVIVDGNDVTAPSGADHYGITAVYSDDGFITGNTIRGWPQGHAILRTDGGRQVNTNLTVSGNVDGNGNPVQ